MHSRTRRQGFTLIKQLFLLPNIALIPAILYPLCFQTREKPKSANAAKPLKQVAAKPAAAPAKPQTPDELWVQRVEPLLDKLCLKCHAGVRQQGGLDLRSLETMLRGGVSGATVIPGSPDESRLVQIVLPKSTPHMPPDPRKQLSAAEIDLLKTWIARMPAPKSKPVAGAGKTHDWAQEYMADYHRVFQSKLKPPADLSATATIDWFLQASWKRSHITPARPSSDAQFARRLYLDVAGRIPTPDELAQFVAEARSDKRQRLIAKLLASDDYARNMREVFDTVLMGRANDNRIEQRAERGWNAFLEEAFRANRPWNEVVHDLLVARATEGTKRGAVVFLAERNNNHQAMAEAVAPVVFGVQIKCAQCHNHPLAWEIEQRHYWGLVTAFNRSKNVATPTGTAVSESAIGGFINFANLKKESQPATLVFLNGKSVPERIPAPDEKEMDNPALYLVPPDGEGKQAKVAAVPKFSRRLAFADAVTRENPLLARAFVNRMWAKLMGRGIVHPADLIDSKHRPSHPELLEWLARDFERSGYDIKRLVQALVSTQAYQLDSKPSGKTPPLPETFARAIEKPLSAEQYARSLVIAAGATHEGNKATEWDRTFAAVFPDLMPETYNPSLQQAMFLTNSPIFNRLLQTTPNSTLTRLTALGSNEARVREAFRVVLGRAPDAMELQQCQALLATRTPEKGVRNLLWALLTSAEFQVNH